ncbi:MAG: S1 RNA-binding domain-containing protein, partial [Lewinella sp.]|nr:S1 RNA-binding domain-containing protein [Lewinella sp.]
MLDEKDQEQQEVDQTPEAESTEETTPQAEAETPAEEVAEEVAESKKEEAPEAAEETAEVVAEAATEEVAEAKTEETADESNEEEETEEEGGDDAKSEDGDSEEEEEEEDGDDVDIDVDSPTGETGSAHDDFDWGLSGRAESRYSDEERARMLQEFDESMSAIQELEIVAGKVTAVNDGDVVLDINFKSDGLVPLSEFRDTPDLAVGDIVEVYVEQQEDARGQLVLSRRKAKLLRAWESIRDSYENGTVITGTIISKTKGGLI